MYKDIAGCYQGQSVFITGGTGFLGKVFLEKLLYSCPGIDKIYLLVKETKDATAEQRVQKVLELPIFTRIREQNPQVLDKIIPIVGDITVPELGIKADVQNLLADKVSIIFHMAATVKFNAPLPEAMNVNVAGTENVLKLAKKVKNIKVLVYVSTAYSNTDKKVIDEVIYPAPASLDEIKKQLAIGINKNQADELIKCRPNSYMFTKALTESFLAENHENVPVVVIRPSIVTSSLREPMVGWVDNGCQIVQKVDVYNCCTSSENPIKIKDFINQTVEFSIKHKFYDVPMPRVFFTQYKWLVVLLTLLLQTLPAYIADLVSLIMRRETKFIKLLSKVSVIRDKLEYFTLRSWIMRAPRTRALVNTLSPSDKINFPFDPADINWIEYIPTYCQGIKQYLHKNK